MKLIRVAATIMEVANKNENWRYTLRTLQKILASTQEMRDSVGKVVEPVFSTLSAHQQDAIDFFMRDFPAKPEDTTGGIIMTAQLWVGSVVDNANMQRWSDCETGVQIEEALQGKAFGMLLPFSEYGNAGVVVQAFAKMRLYRAIKQRGEGWEAMPGQTPVLYLADEVQELLTRDDLEMLPQARSLGLYAAWATQTVEGIETRFTEVEAKKLLDSLCSRIFLKTSSQHTREFIEESMGTCYRAAFSAIPADGVGTQGMLTELSMPVAGLHGRAGDLARRTEYHKGASVYNVAGGGAAAAVTQTLLHSAKKLGEVAEEIIPALARSNRQLPTVQIGPMPIVDKNEASILTMAPNTALAVVRRADVDRRDVIVVEPVSSLKFEEEAA